MLPTTLVAITAVLRADPSVSELERKRLLTILRKGPESTEPEQKEAVTARIVRRAEASRMLGGSLRTLDRLSQEGSLRKVKFPGRSRSCGFLESEIREFLEGRPMEEQTK